MNSDSASSLRTGDREDFARALDEALRLAPRPEHGESGGEPAPDAERLRAMALSAIEPITASASAEFHEYRKQREQAAEERRDAALSGRSAQRPASGAGLVAVVAVLTPVLAAIAAVIFLVLGYTLHAVSTPEPAIAAPLRTAGWVFAVVAALGILAGMAGLLVTALRNSSTALRDVPLGELPPEVAAAREAWLAALVQRGILPFLEKARAQAGDGAARAPGARVGGVHGALDEQNGYGRRDHGLRDTDAGARDGTDGAQARRAGPSQVPPAGPGYSRPDFSSPDFTGPDPGGSGPAGPGPRFSSPRFTSPDFTSPDFTSPDVGGSEREGR